MQLTEIQVRHFKNLVNFQGHLSKGLTVFKGPNEAGKTSLIQAIRASLFSDPASPENKLLHWRRWKADRLFFLMLAFEHEGKSYRLEKDFEKKTLCLTEGETGRTWHDYQEVGRILAGIMGFFSEKIFLNSVCIFQEDLRDFQLSNTDLKSLLWRQTLGPGSRSGRSLLSELDREIEELGKAVSGECIPGSREDIRETLAEVTRQAGFLRETMDSKTAALNEIEKISEKMEDVSRTLEAQKVRMDKVREFLETETFHKEKKRGLSIVERDLGKVIRAGQEIEKYTGQLHRNEETYAREKQKLEKSREYQEIYSRCRDLRKTKESFDREINQIKQLILAREWLSTTLADMPKISPNELEEARGFANSLRLLQGSLSDKGIRVRFRLPDPASMDIEADGEKIDVSRVSSIEGKDRIRLSIPGMGELEAVNLDHSVKSAMERTKEQEDLLAKLLKRYKVKDISELGKLCAERQKIEREAETKEIELRSYLRGRDYKVLVRRCEELNSELNSLEAKRRALKQYAVSFEELAIRQGSIYEKKDEIEYLKRRLEGPRRILQEFQDVETLYEEKDRILKDISEAERKIETLSSDDLRPDELEALKEDIQKSSNELTALEIKRESLNKIIEDKGYGWEALSEKEEQRRELEKKLQADEKQLRIKQIIRDTLREAEHRLFLSMADRLDRHISSYLSLMTRGKYKTVRMNRSDFTISVYSEEKGAHIKPGDDLFSSGLNDQIYLASRLAFIRILAGKEMLPIILDDPFIHFDRSRREETLKILKELSKLHQVLLFTCHDFHDAYADRLIEFSGR